MNEQNELPSDSAQDDKRARLVRLLAERARAHPPVTGNDVVSGPPATAATLSRADELPLSYAQQRIWFAEQLAPGTWTYHIPLALRMRGELDTAALDAALTEVVARHETLRTTFADIGNGPSARIAPPVPVRAAAFELPPCDEASRETRFEMVWRDEIRTPFDLGRGPLMRRRLLRLSRRHHVLFLTAHHLVCDGLSIGLVVHEIAAAYNAYAVGTRPDLPLLPAQYVDCAAAERRRVEAGQLDHEVAYWRKQLAHAATLDLPLDRRRPSHPSHGGALEQAPISLALVRALRDVGARNRATLFMTLLAGFTVLLNSYTSQDDIVVGSPVSGRSDPEMQPLIGCFINTLAFRVDLSGDPTFAELLGRVRETALAAYERRTVPFDTVIEQLHLERDMSRAPLVQVFFNLVNHFAGTPVFRELDVEMLNAEEEGAKFDLTLYAIERPDDLLLRTVYATDLFDAATVAEMMQRFGRVLDIVAEHPERRLSQLTLMSEAEESDLLRAFNAPLA